MPDLSVRKLESYAYEQLQKRAVAHGVSMEEEARQIIYRTVLSPNRILDIFDKYFGQEHGVNLDSVIPKRKHKSHKPIDFSK